MKRDISKATNQTYTAIVDNIHIEVYIDYIMLDWKYWRILQQWHRGAQYELYQFVTYTQKYIDKMYKDTVPSIVIFNEIRINSKHPISKKQVTYILKDLFDSLVDRFEEIFIFTKDNTVDETICKALYNSGMLPISFKNSTLSYIYSNISSDFYSYISTIKEVI